MRFISADIVYPVTSDPLENGVVVLTADGRVADVLAADSPHLPDHLQTERHSGIICPGFVNAHCHLELSHMQGLIPEGTGLDGFIGGIVSQRDAEEEIMAEAQQKADATMWNAGIQAVGDICNTDSSIATKCTSRIRYHSFIEVLGVMPDKANEVMQRAELLAESFAEKDLSFSIVPHAPYSVSRPLFGLLAQRAMEEGTPISMHNQETESEDEMFRSGKGKLIERLHSLGLPMGSFAPTGENSIRSTLPLLPRDERVMLVHNTFTSESDMRWAMQQNPDVFWCTCPTANSYIEGRVPQVENWLRSGATVCLGTDSLASNHQLSILEEMRLLTAHCPDIPFTELLRMATINGAKALDLENSTGSLETSKAPGILLLEHINLQEPRITEAVTVRRLV